MVLQKHAHAVRRLGRRLTFAGAVLLGVLTVTAGAGAATREAARTAAAVDLGPNVKIFDPSMPTSEIKAAIDAIAAQQVSNQFGPERYTLLFKPGTYGSASNPLNFQVG